MYEIGAFERGKYELATALSCFTKAQIYCHVADGKACFHIRGGAPRDFKCLDSKIN